MPRAKIKKVVELDITPRDFVMARLSAARATLQSSIDAIDDAVNLFLEPEDDTDGSERKDLIDAAIEGAGAATRALESADEVFPQVDHTECEPWDEESDDDETEEDEDE